MSEPLDDSARLLAAVRAAREGQCSGNNPYGAVVVRAGEIVAVAHNAVATTCDGLAHAETRALSSACKALVSTDLTDCELYCTCEPCILCVGAILWTGIKRVVYGASDPVNGAVDALRGMAGDVQVTRIQLPECEQLLREIHGDG